MSRGEISSFVRRLNFRHEITKDMQCLVKCQKGVIKSVDKKSGLPSPYLADIGVLSVDELLLVLSLFPLAMGVDAFRGDELPKPTGVRSVDCLPAAPAPLLIDEDLRTELPPRGESSELSEMFDPVREGGREPLRPGSALARRDVKPTCSSM